MRSTIVVAIVAVLLQGALANPSQAGCKKWKYEIVKLTSDTVGYGKTFTDYTIGKIDADRFQAKKAEFVKRLEDLRGSVSANLSCADPDGKFENRKQLLLSWIERVLTTIDANEELASDVVETLRADFFED